MVEVGTFGDAIKGIRAAGLEDACKARIQQNLPTFMICVGLQILCRQSAESPGVEGMGILDTQVGQAWAQQGCLAFFS